MCVLFLSDSEDVIRVSEVSCYVIFYEDWVYLCSMCCMFLLILLMLEHPD
jgi:hypothetical protein